MNGIGGRTIAEAQQNMSLVEARQWAQYRLRHGGLNTAERVEQAAALICATAAQLATGKKHLVKDFIPNRESDDELKFATLEDFMNVLKVSRKQ